MLLASPAEGFWGVAEWSPDDHRLLVVRLASGSDHQLYQLDLATGELTRLHETAEPVRYDFVTYAPDGTRLYATSTEDSILSNRAFSTLRIFPLSGSTA